MLEAHYCKKCGKEFYPTPEHVYKDYTGMYCCWTCFDHHRKTQNYRRKPVEVLEGGEVIATYPSAVIASKVFHVSEEGVKKACRTNSTYKGYHWRYANTNNKEKTK